MGESKMTIIDKLSAVCVGTVSNVTIIGRTGYWTIIEYTLGEVQCQATLIVS